MLLGVVAVGLGLWASTALATPTADLATAAASSLSSTELKQLRSRLRGRSTARLSQDGVWTVVKEPKATSEGLAFEATSPAGAPLPNLVPWSQVDTLWVRGDRAMILGVLGFLAGGILAERLGDPEGAGEYTSLARLALFGTGAVVGATAGAFGGSRLRTWHLVYPIEPAATGLGVRDRP